MGWTTRIQFAAGAVMGIFLFTTTTFRSALGHTHPPIQWVPGGSLLFPPAIRRPGCKADYSLLFSAKVKNA